MGMGGDRERVAGIEGKAEVATSVSASFCLIPLGEPLSNEDLRVHRTATLFILPV